MVWRKTIEDFNIDHLDDETIAEAIALLKRR
jgi:hypothetical protein